MGKKRKYKLGTCTISQTNWKNYFLSLFTAEEANEYPEGLEIEEPDDEIENLISNSEKTDDEILNAVKSFKTGKLPRPNGLFAELFK